VLTKGLRPNLIFNFFYSQKFLKINFFLIFEKKRHKFQGDFIIYYFFILGKKSKFRLSRLINMYLVNVYTNFHTNCTNDKARKRWKLRQLSNPRMAKFAVISINSGQTGIFHPQFSAKTYKARKMKFWLKLDQICVNTITSTAFEIFVFFTSQKISKNRFFCNFWKKRHKLHGNQFLFLLAKKLYSDLAVW